MTTAHGRVKTFFDDRGFGFIDREDGADNLFFHINAVANADVIKRGDRVSFQIETNTRNGRLQAQNVHVVDGS
jgi:CspA family cold shock protein